MEIDISRFRDTFFQEADEHVAEMESGLLGLETHPDDEVLNAIFRAAHSIKGASGTFGFEDVMRFTHAMESLLERMRSHEVPSSRDRIELLLGSLDILRRLLEAARNGDAPPAGAEPLSRQLLTAQRASPPPPGQSGAIRVSDLPASWDIQFQPPESTFLQGMDPVLVLRELARLGEIGQIKPNLSRLPPLADLVTDTCYLSWNLHLRTEAPEPAIRDVFAFIEEGAVIELRPHSRAEATAAPHPEPLSGGTRRPPAQAGTIRVATGKVDQLIDLVGELVIAESMATQILASLPGHLRLQEAFAEVERYTRELQERLMGIRMTPVGNVFSRLPRMVRDLAAAGGKEVVLEVRGEETELDKSVAERLADPLLHLVRNAVDHGIEVAAERTAAGKPPAGAIRLYARHQGGSVLLDVSDDGRGLDRKRIFEKGVERGLIPADEGLSDERVYALIFEPGFSTAATVTDVSGRGVGMDVVKRAIDGLNGAITIRNQPGCGVTFRIKLPLTLAILDGLLLRVGHERYVLPLISIMESVAPRREQINSVAGAGDVIVLRGEPLPLVRLNRLLRTGTDDAGTASPLAVIVEHHGKRLALLVDELLGQQQVVIKSLETNFRKIEGALGATILGDGQPALILDVAAIAEMARTAPGKSRTAA